MEIAPPKHDFQFSEASQIRIFEDAVDDNFQSRPSLRFSPFCLASQDIITITLPTELHTTGNSLTRAPCGAIVVVTPSSVSGPGCVSLRTVVPAGKRLK